MGKLLKCFLSYKVDLLEQLFANVLPVQTL